MIVGFSTRISDHVTLSNLFAQFNQEYLSIQGVVTRVFPDVGLNVYEIIHSGRLPFVALDAMTMAHPNLAVFALHENLDWGNLITQMTVNPVTSYITLIGVTFDSISSLVSKRYLDLGIQEIHTIDELERLLKKGGLLPKNHQWEWDQLGKVGLPKDVRNSILLMNSGDYYSAHDGLEQAWREAGNPLRILYRALLQACIAYYQVERNNYRGAVKTILRFRKWAELLPDEMMGVNVAKLKSDIDAIFQLIKKVGPKEVSNLVGEIKPVEFIDSPTSDA